MCWLIWMSNSWVYAESPSPTIHWGGLGYPDSVPTLELGFTGNRFTEFDGSGRRFNNIRETMGLNFGTMSWTEFWTALPGWSSNLTVGAGPTGEQPTRWLQNKFVHEALFGIPTVPVKQTRDVFDFMIDGSLTYWMDWQSAPHVFFAGGGFSSGSLYHEVFIRGGARYVPVGEWVARAVVTAPSAWLMRIVSGFRMSAMVRYGRAYSGSAFREVAPQTYLGQASASWGIYDHDQVPYVEVETGLSWDSGLFVDFRGDSLEERFVSLFTIRVLHFSFETWNDLINRKDFGPTYGGRLTINVYPALETFLAYLAKAKD